MDREELSDEDVISYDWVDVRTLVAVIPLDIDEFVWAWGNDTVMLCDTFPFAFGDVMEICGWDDVSCDVSTFVGFVMPIVWFTTSPPEIVILGLPAVAVLIGFIDVALSSAWLVLCDGTLVPCVVKDNQVSWLVVEDSECVVKDDDDVVDDDDVTASFVISVLLYVSADETVLIGVTADRGSLLDSDNVLLANGAFVNEFGTAETVPDVEETPLE